MVSLASDASLGSLASSNAGDSQAEGEAADDDASVVSMDDVRDDAEFARRSVMLNSPSGKSPAGRRRSTTTAAASLLTSLEDSVARDVTDVLNDRQAHMQLDSVVTNFSTPDWVYMLFAATGIASVSYSVERERERRDDVYFANPFPGTHEFVTSIKFEMIVGAAIVVNCVLLGWQASSDSDEETGAGFFSICEHFFVALFFIEWCLRVLAFGWVWLFEPMNFFDTILVFGTGVLLKWVMEPMGTEVGFPRMFSVLRLFRLTRLLKTVRFSSFFAELWILVQGLAHSLRPLLWTFIIAMILLYVFAVASTELIGKRDEFEEDGHVQERFGNVLRSMLTMFQLMTLDSWGFDVARPVMVTDWRMGFFFVAFIGIAVFIFWNLITAIIVENAYHITQADTAHQAKEQEEQKKRDLKQLTELFLEIDKDGSGELTTEEFFNAMSNKKVKQSLDMMELKASDLADVWEILDDGDGLLTIKEFVTGIRRMKGGAKAKDVLDCIMQLRHMMCTHSELRASSDQHAAMLMSLEADAKQIQKDTGQIAGLFQEVYHRLEVHLERTKRQVEHDKRIRELARQHEELKVLEEEVDEEEEEQEEDEEEVELADVEGRARGETAGEGQGTGAVAGGDDQALASDGDLGSEDE